MDVRGGAAHFPCGSLRVGVIINGYHLRQQAMRAGFTLMRFSCNLFLKGFFQ